MGQCHRRGVRGPILVGAALSILGCADILGIKDRSLESDASSGESAGSLEAGTSGLEESGSPVAESGLVASGGATDASSGSSGSPAGASGAPARDAAATGASANDAAASGAPSGSTGSTSDGSASGGEVSAGLDAQSPTCNECVLMATSLDHPFAIVSDAARVYWTEFGDDTGSSNGTVKACPLSGCGDSPIVYAQAQLNPRGIAVDAENVYWETAEYGNINGAIWSCPLSGCASPTPIEQAIQPYGIAVDSGFVYWTDYDDGSTHKWSKTDHTDQVLYDGMSSVMIFGVQHCAVDSNYVYETDYNADVYRIPILGGNAVQLVTDGQNGVWPVLAVGSTVYYGTSGSIRTIPIAGGTNPKVLANVVDPDGLSLDPSTNTLYWSDWGSGTATDGTVGKIDLTSGTKVIMASALATPEDVTISGDYAYWLSNGTLDKTSGSAFAGTGALMRAPK